MTLTIDLLVVVRRLRLEQARRSLQVQGLELEVGSSLLEGLLLVLLRPFCFVFFFKFVSFSLCLLLLIDKKLSL